MNEIWKDIKGYEGLYQISNYGRVLSLHPHKCKRINPIIKKNEIIKNGYERVELCKNSKKERKLVHVLVASAFISNIENKTEINHIDGDKNNNHVTNLEWVTHSENMKHASDNGLVDVKKAKAAHCLVVNQYDLKGNFIKQHSSCVSAKAETGATNISLCLAGKRKSSGGFIWKTS